MPTNFLLILIKKNFPAILIQDSFNFSFGCKLKLLFDPNNLTHIFLKSRDNLFYKRFRLKPTIPETAKSFYIQFRQFPSTISVAQVLYTSYIAKLFDCLWVMCAYRCKECVYLYLILFAKVLLNWISIFNNYPL